MPSTRKHLTNISYYRWYREFVVTPGSFWLIHLSELFCSEFLVDSMQVYTVFVYAPSHIPPIPLPPIPTQYSAREHVEG